jgi:phage terminase large subunit-like protein
MSLPVRLHARQLERAITQTAKIECKRVYLPVSAPWLETFEAEIASFLMSNYFDLVDSMVQFLYLSILLAAGEHQEQPF